MIRKIYFILINQNLQPIALPSGSVTFHFSPRCMTAISPGKTIILYMYLSVGNLDGMSTLRSLSKFSLDIKPTGYWNNHEVTVTVDERFLVHVCVASIYVDRNALAEHRTAIAHHRLETIDEGDLFVGGRFV